MDVGLVINLRYSPDPLETMSSSSIEEYNDYKNKCLYEYGA